MNSIEALINYVNDQSAEDDVRTAQVELGDARLRVVAIKILGWLKSQHRLSKFRDLPLRKDKEWCVDATSLMLENRLFLDMLQIDESLISFAGQLSDSDKAALCETVDQGFAPRLLTRD